MIRKIFQTFLAKIFSSGISFIVVIISSRFLGAEIRGEISLLMVGLTLINIASGLIGGSALVFLTPRFNIRALILSSYFFSIITSLAGGVILSVYFPAFHFLDMFFIALAGNVLQANQNILLGKSLIRKFNGLQIFQVLLLLASLLVFFHYIRINSIDSYLFSLCISIGLTAILSFVFIYEYLKPEKVDLKFMIRKLFKHGLQIQLASIIQLMNYRLGYFFLQFFGGLATLGIFANGVVLGEAMWLFSKSLATILYSHTSNSNHSENLRKITRKYAWISMGGTVLLLLPLLLVPESFYLILMGEDFKGMKPVLYYLSPGIIFLSGSTIITHYFSGLGKNYLNTWGSFIGLIITLIPGYFLIRNFGMAGAGITMSLSYFLSGIYLLVKFRK